MPSRSVMSHASVVCAVSLFSSLRPISAPTEAIRSLRFSTWFLRSTRWTSSSSSSRCPWAKSLTYRPFSVCLAARRRTREAWRSSRSSLSASSASSTLTRSSTSPGFLRKLRTVTPYQLFKPLRSHAHARVVGLETLFTGDSISLGTVVMVAVPVRGRSPSRVDRAAPFAPHKAPQEILPVRLAAREAPILRHAGEGLLLQPRLHYGRDFPLYGFLVGVHCVCSRVSPPLDYALHRWDSPHGTILTRLASVLTPR